MDIDQFFSDAWKLFVKDIAALIIGALLVGILSVVSLGILAGPLWGGLHLMVVRRVREGRPAEIGDVFSAFDRFWTLLAAAIVLTILIALGLVLLIVPGVLLATIWIYVPLFIVDKGMGLGEAMRASRERVTANGFGMHIVVVLLIWILSAILGGIAGIGFLLSWPLTVTFITAMYFRFGGEGTLVDAATGTAWAGTAGGPPPAYPTPPPPADPPPPPAPPATPQQPPASPQSAPAQPAARQVPPPGPAQTPPPGQSETAQPAGPQPSPPAVPAGGETAPAPPESPSAFPGSVAADQGETPGTAAPSSEDGGEGEPGR
jgi:hypothetical protein